MTNPPFESALTPRLREVRPSLVFGYSLIYPAAFAIKKKKDTEDTILLHGNAGVKQHIRHSRPYL